MRPSRVLIQAIVIVVAGVYLVAFLVQGLPTGDLLRPLGAAGAAAGLFVLLFDNFLWRIPKLGRRISKRPDARGTWRGTLTSQWIDDESGEQKDPDAEVYLVVRQTFWSVSANLITRESKSCSTTAVIEDDGCGQYQLVAVYTNTPRAAVRERSAVHNGAFKLDVTGEPVARLEGFYWTDRKTIGEFEFDRRSKKFVESYAAAQKLGL